jgi:hypothetical protein
LQRSSPWLKPVDGLKIPVRDALGSVLASRFGRSSNQSNPRTDARRLRDPKLSYQIRRGRPPRILLAGYPSADGNVEDDCVGGRSILLPRTSIFKFKRLRTAPRRPKSLSFLRDSGKAGNRKGARSGSIPARSPQATRMSLCGRFTLGCLSSSPDSIMMRGCLAKQGKRSSFHFRQSNDSVGDQSAHQQPEEQ